MNQIHITWIQIFVNTFVISSVNEIVILIAFIINSISIYVGKGIPIELFYRYPFATHVLNVVLVSRWTLNYYQLWLDIRIYSTVAIVVAEIVYPYRNDFLINIEYKINIFCLGYDPMCVNGYMYLILWNDSKILHFMLAFGQCDEQPNAFCNMVIKLNAHAWYMYIVIGWILSTGYTLYMHLVSFWNCFKLNRVNFEHCYNNVHNIINISNQQ